MHRKISNIVSVLHSILRFCLLKILHFGDFSFQGIQRFSPNVSIELEKGGKLTLGKRVRAHSGVKVKVRSGGKLNIGKDASFNYNCMIFCHDSITIQEGVEFGPGVLVYDHDHDYKTNGGIKEGKFVCSPVVIGANSWIGANTIILRGSVIGKDCVIAAGSIVKGNVPDGTVFIQKRHSEIIKSEEK
ncbi:MAG: acyltransferase [Clostridiaceae bacterium]|nr:acyltransferase [Clostridiaceae bacterium]